MRMTEQRQAVLEALAESRGLVPTTVLYDVRATSRFRDSFGDDVAATYRIGEPVGRLLRHLRDYGLVRSAPGHDCNGWAITPRGREVLREWLS